MRNWFSRKLKFKDLGIGDKFIVYPDDKTTAHILYEKTMDQTYSVLDFNKHQLGQAKELFAERLNNIVNVDINQRVIKVLSS